METDDVHVGTAEHQKRKDDEAERKIEGDESRKTGRPPTSRIPTFQSSMARKRTTNQTAESLPTKTEASLREGQIKERGASSGELSRTKLPVFGDREMALPPRSPYTESSSNDDFSPSDSPNTTSETSEAELLLLKPKDFPEPKPYVVRSSEELEGSLQRPGLRTESCLTDSLSESPLEQECARIELLCKDKLELETIIQNEFTAPSSACTFAEEHPPERSVTVEPSEEQQSSEEQQPQSLQEDEEYLKEPPCHGSVMKDSDMKRPLLKPKSKVPDETCSEASQKQKVSHVSTRSKTADTARIEQSKSSSSSKSKGKSFAFFCLFSSLLLLLGGFGQHIWLYGVPKSVSHLMVQLELHWLESFWLPQEECSTDCRLTLVESIPEGMHFAPGSLHLSSVAHTWTNLLKRANRSVNIAAFYFTLRDSDIGFTDPSSVQGKELLDHLKDLASRGVNLKVAVNAPQTYKNDTDELAETGAEVREVDLQSITGGIIHTKLWIVDKKHMYVGSANMDWRSLTQVKEVGISVEDCSCLAQDASRIFGVYWEIGAEKNASVPSYWPGRFSALSSSKYPLAVKFNGVPARVYLSSAPPQLSAYGRSDDLSAILSVIKDAKEFIRISIMDYIPMSQFTEPKRFWPAIDSALREAACARGVEVNLLVSCWRHSPGSMFLFLQSLSVLSKTPLRCNIHIKVFEVPSTPEQLLIPFTRVNHAKYMVTDRVVYIGTSNWSENYFTQTAGVGLVVNQTGSVVGKGQKTVQNQLQKIFLRDWNSDFAQTLADNHVEYCSRKNNI